MRIKDKKVSIAARTLREFRQRDAAAYRQHMAACIAASKCRYRGYFSLAAASATGHYVDDYTYSRVLRVWAIFPQGACSSSILDDWRGVSGWRQAKKLAARLRPCHRPAWRTGHWLKVMPWRCA